MSAADGKPYPLSNLKSGITRLRTKGGASAQSLFDLVNGHLDAAGAPTSRFGTRWKVQLPPGSIGLTYFDGQRHVFGDHPIPEMASPFFDDYHLNILRHPTDDNANLVSINFAEPMMGALYVSATFESLTGVETTIHYWLVPASVWTPDTVYRIGDVVEPTVPNGFTYRAKRPGAAAIVWAPNVLRAIGDVVEPTTYNGYQFTVIDTYGANPRSGASEPVWPTETGATVVEDTDGANPPAPSGNTGDPSTTLPPDIEDRYDNGNWSGAVGQALQ